MHQSVSFFRTSGYMEQNSKQFFMSQSVDIPAGLLQKVMERIEKEQNLLAMRRAFAVAVTFFALSAAALVRVWEMFRVDIIRAGLDQYMLLVFSDFKTTAVHWQDFSLNLLESIPVMSTVLLLSVVVAFLIALKKSLNCSSLSKSSGACCQIGIICSGYFSKRIPNLSILIRGMTSRLEFRWVPLSKSKFDIFFEESFETSALQTSRSPSENN